MKLHIVLHVVLCLVYAISFVIGIVALVDVFVVGVDLFEDAKASAITSGWWALGGIICVVANMAVMAKRGFKLLSL